MYTIPRYRVQLVREGTFESETISSPDAAISLLRSYFEDVDREHLVVLLLDVQPRIIGINTVSIGSLNSSIVHPREVFKPAILANAASVVVAHNHPSGDPHPTDADIDTTKRLKAAGQLLGIPVLDHIVIGDTRTFSFKAHGLL